MNKTLTDIVRGKRVCVVGPAGYLKEKDGFGKIIDEYDVVIRVTKLWFCMSDETEDYLGKRTDVIYTSGCPNDVVIPLYKKHKIKINNEGVMINIIPVYRHWFRGEQVNFRNVLVNDIKLDNVLQTSKESMEYFKKIDGNTSKPLNTGMIAILDVLQCVPSEMFICGFDFYTSERSKSYVDGYMDYARVNGLKLMDIGKDGHNQKRNVIELKKQFALFDSVQVKLDDVMQNILYNE